MSETAKIPLVEAMTHVSGYDECQEILLAPRRFHTGVWDEASAPVWDGILATSNGEWHLARRRYLATLLSRTRVARQMDAVLDRAVAEWLDELGSGETLSFDVMEFVRVVTVRVQAAMFGLDSVAENAADARRVLRFVEAFSAATRVRWMKHSEDIDGVVQDAMEKLEAFGEEFYWPAVRRREQLLAAAEAGEIARDELPDDLIMRQVLPEAKPLWDDRMALRDAMAFVTGGTGTTAMAVTGALELYLPWAGRRREREGDREYVRGVANEALRLSPPIPYLLRRAAEDVTLRTGRSFFAGEFVALHVDEANRDQAIFGEDATEFRPERGAELRPPHHPYGLAFGAGPHLCPGRPLVTTGSRDQRETTVERVMTRILLACFRGGVERDVDRTAEPAANYLDPFRTYPIVLTRARDALEGAVTRRETE